MKVLSLFDGMACGMIAMQLAGMEVESYDAYEIDKYAIKTAQHNFPMIKEHGDVFDADFTQYEGVDFLIGGSPCTYWSIAQTKNRETVASGMGWELFSQYVRALHEAKPKYFIYENNKSMSKQIRASIDKAFGFEAVLINSALVSAQNRQRLYWVGRRNEDGSYSKLNVEQPADRGILLKDVLDSAVARDLTSNDKAYTLTASYDGACAWNTIERHQRNTVAEPLVTTKNGKSFAITANYVHMQDYPNDYAAHTIEKSVKPLVAESVAFSMVGNFGNRKVGVSDKAYCLAANPSSDMSARVAEPVCLRYERTEEAKRCRKAYEAHEIKHGYNELNELHPRPDGKTNTLTTVLKDNQIMEPVCVAERGRMYCGQPQHYEAGTDGKTNTLTSVEKDNRVAEPISYCTDKNIEHLMRNFGSKGKIVDEESKTPTLMAAAGMGGGNHIYYADLIAEPINMTADGKAQCLRATCYKDGIRNIIANEVDKKTGVAEPVKVGDVGNGGQGNRVYSVNGKAVAQTAQSGGMGSNTGLYAEPINVTADGKAQCLRATCYKDGIRNIIANEVDKKTGVAEPINVESYEISHTCDFNVTPSGTLRVAYTDKSESQGYRVYCADYKSVAMRGQGNGRGAELVAEPINDIIQVGAMPRPYAGYVIEFDDDGRPIKAIGKDGKEITIYEVRDGKITIKGKQYPIKLKDGYYIIRKLTVRECMRLQTVPEWYEFPVSDSQAYKMLGNGWTCEVIAHILKSLKEA